MPEVKMKKKNKDVPDPIAKMRKNAKKRVTQGMSQTSTKSQKRRGRPKQ